MTHRRRQLTARPDAPFLPELDTVAMTGLQDAGPHDSQRGLDTLIDSSARVLMSFGLGGGASFLVPDGADPVGPEREYPDNATARVAARLEGVALTPGCIVALELVALPSGPTQGPDPNPDVSGYVESGRSGAVELHVRYSNGVDAKVVSVVLELEGSDELHGAEPPYAHGELIAASVVALPVEGPDVLEAAKYLRGNDVRADVTARLRGSPRIVEAQIVERPFELVAAHGESRWPSNLYAEGEQAYEELPADYPVQRISPADPGGGTEALGRALLEHGRQLGPALAWWSAADEGADLLAAWIAYDGGTGDDEAPPLTTTSASFVAVPSQLAPGASAPAMLAGHSGRDVIVDDEVLDGRTGVLPVVAGAYIKGANVELAWRSGGDEWSQVLLRSSADAWQWVEAAGWLEVGMTTEDAPALRLLVRSVDGTLAAVRCAGVWRRPT